MGMIKCTFDSEVLHSDEAEYLPVGGEGKLPFCGPDCHLQYLARKQGSKLNKTPHEEDKDLESRVGAVESTLAEILKAIKDLGKK